MQVQAELIFKTFQCTYVNDYLLLYLKHFHSLNIFLIFLFSAIWKKEQQFPAEGMKSWKLNSCSHCFGYIRIGYLLNSTE